MGLMHFLLVGRRRVGAQPPDSDKNNNADARGLDNLITILGKEASFRSMMVKRTHACKFHSSDEEGGQLAIWESSRV
jgi:hypothetical protein